MSVEVHQIDVQKGGAQTGRTVISTPGIPSPAPNHRKNLIFTDGQKQEPPNYIVPKDVETTRPVVLTRALFSQGEGGFWHKASVLGRLPLAAPVGLSPLLILTLCGPERVLVVSTEPLDDLSCLTTPGSAVPETGCCPCR